MRTHIANIGTILERRGDSTCLSDWRRGVGSSTSATLVFESDVQDCRENNLPPQKTCHEFILVVLHKNPQLQAGGRGTGHGVRSTSSENSR